jgi:hypothetical protein
MRYSLLPVVHLTMIVALAGCSGTVGKLRENSEKAAKDRMNAWDGRKTESHKPTKEEKRRAKEAKKKSQTDHAWDETQKEASDQIRQEDREYLNQDGENPKKSPDASDSDDSPAVDVATTQDFPTFVRMVREAVRTRDANALAPLMTPNFGYQLEPLMEGPGVFEFWEKHILWAQLELIIGQQFVASGKFMVAPPEFASNPGYAGYRAGMVKTRSGWRFAYFVQGQ